MDNAIPVCYNCHAALGRYFKGHPRGNKYRFKEIKMRRDQIYERYTQHLIPGILPVMHPILSEKETESLRVGFSITPSGRFIPVKARIVVKTFLGRKELDQIDKSEKPYYSGGILWNLNPGVIFHGNFSLPAEYIHSEKNLTLELRVTVIDPYEREHELLPICFTYVRPAAGVGGYWFMEPTSFGEFKRYMK